MTVSPTILSSFSTAPLETYTLCIAMHITHSLHHVPRSFSGKIDHHSFIAPFICQALRVHTLPWPNIQTRPWAVKAAHSLHARVALVSCEIVPCRIRARVHRPHRTVRRRGARAAARDAGGDGGASACASSALAFAGRVEPPHRVASGLDHRPNVAGAAGAVTAWEQRGACSIGWWAAASKRGAACPGRCWVAHAQSARVWLTAVAAGAPPGCVCASGRAGRARSAGQPLPAVDMTLCTPSACTPANKTTQPAAGAAHWTHAARGNSVFCPR